MTVMPAPSSQHQWYLAREGQQYGPLTDPELAKFVELGHLQPTDLLWREGFPDWRPALVVFPTLAPGAAERKETPAPPQAGAKRVATTSMDAMRPGADAVAAGKRVSAVADSDDALEPRRRFFGARLLKRLFAVAIILTGAWFAYVWRADLGKFIGAFGTSSSTSVMAATDRNGIDVPPLRGFGPDAAQMDANLQATPLWRILKREFPEWYSERLKEIAALTQQSKDDSQIAQQMGRALVTLRRQQTDNALSASLPNLKRIASTFYDNIAELRKQSTEACFAFISQGEASPLIVALLQGSPHAARLQTQLVSVFEAAADGRKLPRVYPKPRKTDYETLATALTSLGWSQADMQLFSDERELARAAPDKICQLVHDWFAAQLGLTDADVQLRLLVDSLRPVVAG
jgi:GYF domain 2